MLYGLKVCNAGKTCNMCIKVPIFSHKPDHKCHKVPKDSNLKVKYMAY